MNQNEIWTAVIAAIGGGLGAKVLDYFLAQQSRTDKRNETETQKLWARVEELEEKVDRQAAQIVALVAENAALKAELDTIRNTR